MTTPAFQMYKKYFKFAIVLLILLATTSPLTAAGPVTHAYLSKRFFVHYPKYSDADKKAFMRGTLFPDIRYLGKVSRSATHFDNVTLDGILNEKSPFIAGMKYHSWVDVERNRYVETTSIKAKIPDAVDPVLHHSYLKLVEEELVYQKEGWNDCCEYLYDISPEELDYQMDKETVLRWHGMLTLFFKSSPSTALTLLSFFGGGNSSFISREEASKWTSALPTSAQDPLFIAYVEAMLQQFEAKLR